MNKLKPNESAPWFHFLGYLKAAQLMFVHGDLDLTLEAAFYDIAADVTDEEVVHFTYPHVNELKCHTKVSTEAMVHTVNSVLTLPRSYWSHRQVGVAAFIEKRLREGFWKHLAAAIDFENSSVVQVTDEDVPYVNMGAGFTYILYTPDSLHCMLLVANWSD